MKNKVCLSNSYSDLIQEERHFLDFSSDSDSFIEHDSDESDIEDINVMDIPDIVEVDEEDNTDLILSEDPLVKVCFMKHFQH